MFATFSQQPPAIDRIGGHFAPYIILLLFSDCKRQFSPLFPNFFTAKVKVLTKKNWNPPFFTKNTPVSTLCI
jgi:hypothetical protein